MRAEQPNPRLRTYVVWVPKRGAEEKDVGVATRLVPDTSAMQYWDGSGVTMHAYDKVLGLGQDAWDVYFLYGPTARWDRELPPKPDYWMHQISTTKGPTLDPDTFASQTRLLLRTEPRAQ